MELIEIDPTRCILWRELVADMGRGTCWNPLRRPTLAGVGPATGYGALTFPWIRGLWTLMKSVATSNLGCGRACNGSWNLLESAVSSNLGDWQTVLFWGLCLQLWAMPFAGIPWAVSVASASLGCLWGGRGTWWNPLHHQILATGTLPSFGRSSCKHGLWNLLGRPTSAGAGPAKGHGTRTAEVGQHI